MLLSTLIPALLVTSISAWAAPVTISTFTPQSLTEPTNQIRAVFSTKMVPLGVHPEANIFNVECNPQVQGQAHWADEKVWVYDFTTALTANKIPGGTRCKVSLKPGIKDVKGVTVSGKTAFQFQVDGPNLISIYPGDTNGVSRGSIAPDQVFALGLDAEVDADTVLKNAYFKIDGIASNVQLRILSEVEKRKIMTAANFPHWMFSKELPLIMVQAKQTFPDSRRVSLVWGKGIASTASGLSRQRDLILPFASQPLFQANFSCERENAHANCSPFSDMSLSFNADIPASLAKQVRLVGANGQIINPVLKKGDLTVRELVFPASVMEKQSYRLELPAGLKDESGRPLSNGASFPMTVKTAEFPPLAKFAADFGILEANVQPVLLPATLRNLEAQVIGKGLAPTSVDGSTVRLSGKNFATVIQWMKKLDIKENRAGSLKDRNVSVFNNPAQGKPKTFHVPLKPNGKSFEVVGIPLPGPGFYVVELQSRLLGNSLLGRDASMFVPSGALVTNLVVHSKWGKENSLFWVTELDSGMPVSGAEVSVYDCAGKVIASGLTSDASGLVRLNEDLRSKIDPEACASERRGRRSSDGETLYSRYDSGFFVTAQRGDDFTFTHSGWNEGIEAFRFANYSDLFFGGGGDAAIAHTVLDRTLLRAGETVSMKHFMRNSTTRGLALMANQNLPNQVWIEHTDTGAREVADLKWDASGTAVSRYAIPKEAKLGLYSITLVRTNGTSVVSQYGTSTFQVMEFKVPQMRGMITFPKDVLKLVQPGNLESNLSVTYQDGGPVGNKPVTFRYTVDRAYGLNYSAYPNFSFASERVVERHGRDAATDSNVTTVQVPARLDAKGSTVVSIPNLSGLTSVKQVTAQLEFTDSNSEVQNVTRTVNVFPSSQLVGIESENSYSSKKDLRVKIAVVDLKGKPVVGTKPQLEFFERITYTHKTKMVGGFYSAENFTDINPMSSSFQCEGGGLTDKRGVVSCVVQAPQSGQYVVQASTQDSNGHRSFASAYFYVSGIRRAWFPPDNNDRMDLLAEKSQAQSGDEATFQVKMPFDQAKVLVTVEREGILDAFVTDVSTHDPVVRVKMKPEYAPNVFISALAVRGRVAGSEPTAIVDLGKPAFKMGLTTVNVNWRDHSLNVQVKPTKDTFKPRETASVEVTVLGPNGKPAANAEFALAVVDNGLLQLAKNSTWDLLKAMMSGRHLSVQTATAQMQVVGKRHFGLKARPTGGDGGSAPTRELFDTLVTWIDRVKTDANGKSTVSFKMNDSLSAFKVVAIAHNGVNQFGTGEHDIVTQQDISIIPAVAQLARNGDNFAADFTLRNSSKVSRTVIVGGRAQLIMADGTVQYIDLPDQTIALGPQGAQLVSLGNVRIPDNVVRIVYEVSARDSVQGTIDHIKITQTVAPAVTVRTWMAQLSRIDSRLAPIGVQLPSEAIVNQGGVSVAFMPSLTGGLTTVQDWLSAYPFMSLEFLVSSAVARGDAAAWDTAMKKLPAYLDSEGFVNYYQRNVADHGSDILTAYILSVSNYSGFAIPSDAQQKMLSALNLFVQGKSKLNRGSAETPADTFIRRVNAIEVLARFGLAQASWLSSLPTVTPAQIPNSTLVNLLSTYTMLAAAPNRTAKIAEIEAAIQGRLTRVGTGKKFNSLVVVCGFCMSSIDTEQLRLILLTASVPELRAKWNDDIPLLVQAAVGMMKRGAWDLTVADSYGVLAMKAYSRAFESQPVHGVTTANLSGVAAKTWDWSAQPKGGTIDFGWIGTGTSTLGLNHNGQGAPWGLVAVRAAVPLKSKVEQNISVVKEVSPVQVVYKKGDQVTVTLTIKAQTTLAQVAVWDPIPAGAKIEGSGLDNDTGTTPGSQLYPDYQALGNDGYHASFGVVPADSFKIVYRMRLNNSGTFKVPPTRVEALYAPENFAEMPNGDVTVSP